jgi:S1-C subfamily serine protease
MELKEQKNRIISQVVILSMIFGFTAGIVGQIVADVYIDPWQQDFNGQNLNGNQDISTIPELRRVKRFLGIEQDFEVNKSVEKVSPSLVGIYSKKPASSNLLNQIYLPENLQANGFILTSDGWVVSYGEAFANFRPEQLVVVYDNQVLSIENIITDSTTGVVFLKIPASNLPVVVLGDSDETISGQLAITLNSLNETIVTNIKNPDYQSVTSVNDYVISSEEYGKSILLTDILEDTYLGAPLVNLGGEIVGIIKEIDRSRGVVTAVPINQFRSLILDVLRSNIVKRPFLGVKYIDLAWAVGLGSSLTQQGALIWQNPTYNTPAADAELKEDDIIVSIDGQPVDKDSSLTELIQQYQPGDEIILEILRNGQTLNKSAILVILPD